MRHLELAEVLCQLSYVQRHVALGGVPLEVVLPAPAG